MCAQHLLQNFAIADRGGLFSGGNQMKHSL
jgi:hypothetical protein